MKPLPANRFLVGTLSCAWVSSLKARSVFSLAAASLCALSGQNPGVFDTPAEVSSILTSYKIS